MYRVEAVKVGDCPVGETSRHIVEVQFHGAGELRRESVGVVRLMLSSGDNLFTISPTTGSRASVTKGRCGCGYKTVRSVRSEVSDNDITSVDLYG